MSKMIGNSIFVYDDASKKILGVINPDGTQANFDSSSQFLGSIGKPGQQGFGAGICPAVLPAGFSAMLGTSDPYSDNYGNYQYSDGSIMVFIPKFYYRLGSTASVLYAVNGVNTIDIAGIDAFPDVASANTAGYALHRAFYNAGVIKDGVFVDKYLCANNSGIASSLTLGNPLSCNAAHNPFSGLTGLTAGDNIYAGALTAAKTRGTRFFCNSRFIFSALALLSVAQGQWSNNSTVCAWYDSTGVNNFPKGNNNNALGDTNDTTLKFISDGYSNASKNGSASVLAKTTHNGQASGVADLNGNLWEINTGFISNGSLYYLLNTGVDIATLTAGNSLSSDAWGAASLAANYTSIGATYGGLTASSTQKWFNSTAQLFDAALTGNPWAATCAGLPLLTGVSGVVGTNMMGNDALYDYRPVDLCPVAGGNWNFGALAGVWSLSLSDVRGNSLANVGFRSALYL